jgi:hypothetical protein
MSHFPESRLKQLEDTAIKERREMETRQNAEELHKYLDFADIDWEEVKDSDFERINFKSQDKIKADSKIYEEILNGGAEFFQKINHRRASPSIQRNNFKTHDQWMIHYPETTKNYKVKAS